MILSESSNLIFKQRYAIHEDESWQELSERVAQGAAQVENNFKYWKDIFASDIYNMLFLPGGRILRNVGRPRGSLFNCYCINIDDTIESIAYNCAKALILWSEGGGVGFNFNSLRPENAPIVQKGGVSTGPISFMNHYNGAAETIKTGGCFAEGTSVFTNKGLINIEDIIKSNEEFYALTHKGYKKITTKFNNGKKEVFKVTTEHGYEIETTKEHKWKLLNGNGDIITKRLSDLCVNDNVLLLNKNEHIEIDYIKLNCNFYYKKKLGCNTLNENVKFPEELNEDLAYLLGYSYGNGFNKSNKCLSVSINKNHKKIKEKIKNISNNLFNLNPTVCNGDGEFVNVNIFSRLLIEWLKHNDILKEKSENIKIPKKIFTSPYSVIKSFIAGYFDADGTNGSGKSYYSFASINKTFLNDIQKLLIYIGIPSKVYLSRKEKENWKKLYKLNCSGCDFYEKFYNEIGKYSLKIEKLKCRNINLSFKYKNVNPLTLKIRNKYFNKIWSSTQKNMTISALNKIIKKDPPQKDKLNFIKKFIEDRIVSIEYVGLKNVYDLEVDDVHMLSCNGFYTSNSRRAAALGLLLCDHPNIIEFIKAKEIEGTFNNFNLSVGVTEKFLEAVETNSDWDLKFNQKTWKTVKAKDLWDLIINKMIHNGEPGLINWDNLRSNNSWFFSPVVGTNPCGEAVLSHMEVCDLGSLVLPNFITGSKNTNWQLMEKTVHNAVRFLDNIIQINRYVIEETRVNASNSRRIGIGIMGLAEYLFAKKIRYGSEEAVQETERLMRNIRNFIYKASIKLSEEKEPFPKFDPVLYSKSHFVRTLPAKIRKDIKKYGIRNVTGIALAPNGTISLLPEVTSCIEPLYCKSYLRHDEIGDRAYIHPIYKNILENNEKIPDWYVDSFDLSPQDHFEMQSICQKYTDGAVSKTINCPKGFKSDQLSELLLEYIRDLKGVTLYVDGSREGQILNPMTKKDTKKYIMEGKEILGQEERDCSTGACEI